MGTKGQILSISQSVQDTSILCFPTINLRGPSRIIKVDMETIMAYNKNTKNRTKYSAKNNTQRRRISC